MEIANSIAIITGAARGIGAAIAEKMLGNGANVVISDIDELALGETEARLRELFPGKVIAKAGDAADRADIATLIDLAENNFGSVDFYFANAGAVVGEGLEATEEQWDFAFDLNLRAHVRAAKLLIPKWLERGRGYFFSTASAAGLLTQIGSPTYATSKHAAVAFAEWLRVTYADQGIRVSTLCPMGVDTDLLNIEGSIAIKAVKSAGSVLTPESVADDVIAAIGTEQFLVLPHAEVGDFFAHKANNYDSWLNAMVKYRQSLGS